ncbi:hypothetical protein QQF64_027746 [Cirrhinus molitorella]|uniref:Secreted protein n=1 Tax=Cirrhinus molitorella TaxID=172907 RepID=A0ABR3NDV7_9TELE
MCNTAALRLYTHFGSTALNFSLLSWYDPISTSAVCGRAVTSPPLQEYTTLCFPATFCFFFFPPSPGLFTPVFLEC